MCLKEVKKMVLEDELRPTSSGSNSVLLLSVVA